MIWSSRRRLVALRTPLSHWWDPSEVPLREAGAEKIVRCDGKREGA